MIRSGQQHRPFQDPGGARIVDQVQMNSFYTGSPAVRHGQASILPESPTRPRQSAKNGDCESAEHHSCCRNLTRLHSSRWHAFQHSWLFSKRTPSGSPQNPSLKGLLRGFSSKPRPTMEVALLIAPPLHYVED